MAQIELDVVQTGAQRGNPTILVFVLYWLQFSAGSGEIQLLLTDVVLPEINGKLLATQIQAARPGIKVLFVSGDTNDVIVHHGVLDSNVAFLQKPFSTEHLARKVREMLDAPA